MAGQAKTLDSASTVTDQQGEGTRPPERQPCLFVLLECARPAAGSARHLLTEIDQVLLGRGGRREARRKGRTLAIALPDERISSRHARLVREFGRWLVEDLGSKNGTRLEGRAHARALLEDGARIEIGHTLLLYREVEPSDLPADCESNALDPLAPGLVTLVSALHRAFAHLARVSRAGTPVLILGESGSGKERVARAIHTLAQRPGTFVAVNCGALPANLVESELFGFCKGAFSGAETDQLGLIRSADRGTLFLDEIGDLPAPAQAALLRVLQEREVTPLGAIRPVPVDIGLCAATHRSLEALSAGEAFRSDLFARLAGFVFELLPLCQRREDIGLIIAELLTRVGGDSPDRLVIDLDAARLLFDYPWPLNVRELEHALKVACALAEENRIAVHHLPLAVRAQAGASKEVANPDESELKRRDELIDLLKQHGGNVSQVARSLGKARPLIYRWLKRYGIDPRDCR